MTVRMAGVEMIDGDPLELRAEILFHLAHKPTDERFEVGKLIAVLGRNDHPELMPILTAAFEERLAVGDIEIGGIKFDRQAFARHAVALDIGEMRLGAAEPLPGKRDISETRRVGKEYRRTCTSRGSPHTENTTQRDQQTSHN